MKNIVLLIALVLSAPFAFGQQTSLNETFNIGCPTGASDPNGWSTYNALPTTTTEGQWQCNPSGGRYGTPGITCSGLYGSPLIYHLDTSILISPALDLHAYSSDIYVNFDTKTTNYNLGAKLEVIVSQDSTMGTADTPAITYPLYKVSGADTMTPIFGMGDETDWVTHHANLTAYKSIVPLYIGFRYTSADGTSGSRWFLDNVNTTTTPYLAVADIANAPHSFSFSGSSNSGVLTLSCTASTADNYTLSVYDMTGRVVRTQALYVSTGRTQVSITDLNVPGGLYILKMTTKTSFSTAKVYLW